MKKIKFLFFSGLLQLCLKTANITKDFLISLGASILANCL